MVNIVMISSPAFPTTAGLEGETHNSKPEAPLSVTSKPNLSDNADWLALLLYATGLSLSEHGPVYWVPRSAWVWLVWVPGQGLCCESVSYTMICWWEQKLSYSLLPPYTVTELIRMFDQTTHNIYLVNFLSINFISRQIWCQHGGMPDSDFGTASNENKIQVKLDRNCIA